MSKGSDWFYSIRKYFMPISKKKKKTVQLENHESIFLKLQMIIYIFYIVVFNIFLTRGAKTNKLMI